MRIKNDYFKKIMDKILDDIIEQEIIIKSPLIYLNHYSKGIIFIDGMEIPTKDDMGILIRKYCKNPLIEGVCLITESYIVNPKNLSDQDKRDLENDLIYLHDLSKDKRDDCYMIQIETRKGTIIKSHILDNDRNIVDYGEWSDLSKITETNFRLQGFFN